MWAAVSERGQLGDARKLEDGHAYARRQALGRILRPRVFAIQDQALGQAYRATNFLGLGAVGAKRWEAISNRGLPKFLDAVEARDAERTELLDKINTFINDLRMAGFQFALKPLVLLSFRLAMREVKAHAIAEGFDPEELEEELRVFQRVYEARILYRSPSATLRRDRD